MNKEEKVKEVRKELKILNNLLKDSLVIKLSVNKQMLKYQIIQSFCNLMLGNLNIKNKIYGKEQDILLSLLIYYNCNDNMLEEDFEFETDLKMYKNDIKVIDKILHHFVNEDLDVIKPAYVISFLINNINVNEIHNMKNKLKNADFAIVKNTVNNLHLDIDIRTAEYGC